MGEIVNLKRFRKQTDKQKEAARAAANRLAHGRSKTQRNLDKSSTQKLVEHLDRHKIDTGDGQ